jgi:MFS family permease
MAETRAVPGAATAEPAQPRKPGVLINRNFALLFGGMAVSLLGDFVFNTTLIVWIAVDLARGQTWAPLAVSGVLIAATVPILLVGPLAGVFVDRWDKRATMRRAALLQAVVVSLLLVASGAVPLPFVAGGQLPLLWTLGAIYAVVFLVNALGQFVNPASIALVGDVVAEPEQPRAMSLLQVAGALATIVGPPVAAPLLLTFGPWWALLIDAASFVVGYVALSAMRVPRGGVAQPAGAQASVAREFVAGLRYVLTNRVLVTVLIAVSVAMLGAGALNALDVFFVTQNLHADPHLYGLVGAATAVGVLVGAVVAGAFAFRVGLARTIWLSLLALSVLVLVWSRMTSFIPALVVVGLVGMANAPLNVVAGPLLLKVTPKRFVGRAAAIILPAINLASLISIALAGWLASTVLVGFHAVVLGVAFGPLDTIFLAAGVLGILGGLYAMVMLRGADAQPAVSEPSERDEAPAPQAS